MKKLSLLLILVFGFCNAQYLIEDNDISENTKELGRQTIAFDLDNPLEFYRLKCESVAYAQFPAGESGFKENLFLNMKSYLDTGVYSVNGTFELILTIGKSGNLQSFQLQPEVPNSNLLKRDLELALRKMNLKWMPATCNGTPVQSKVRQKVNFRTESFDI